MFKRLLPALLLSVFANGANATVVDYTLTLQKTATAEGQFTGTDANHDGLLTFDELNSLTFNIPSYGIKYDFSTLATFGTYDIGANAWFADPTSHTYMQFSSGQIGPIIVIDFNVTNLVTTAAVDPAGVPEPGVFSLVMVGLAAFATARRIKA
jgi:hypothetical protein